MHKGFFYIFSIEEKVFFPGFYIPLKISLKDFKKNNMSKIVLVVKENNFIYDFGVIAEIVDFKVEDSTVKTIYKSISKCRIKSEIVNNMAYVEFLDNKLVENDKYIEKLKSLIAKLKPKVISIFDDIKDFNQLTYYLASSLNLNYKDSLKILSESNPNIKTNIIKNFLIK
jgi:hypothetical protein